VIRADHPFLFIAREPETGAIVFIGRVRRTPRVRASCTGRLPFAPSKEHGVQSLERAGALVRARLAP
jgi:hypothetical protein